LGIESKIRGLEPGIRLEQRQKLSKEMVAKLFANLKKYQRELPKKSTTAQAIGYALGNEVALKRFLGDGKIEIDHSTPHL
jgi:transposase